MPAPRLHNVGDSTGPLQWFQSLPVVTQYWFGAAVVLTLAGNIEVVPPTQLLYAWTNIKEKFELWRILTSFCYVGPFSFNTVITLYMLVSMSKQYEVGGPFNTGGGGGTADYIFALMFAALVTLVTYPLVMMMAFSPPIFTRNLVYFVMYTWSKRFPTAQANIWGIPVPAVYLPFAYLGLTICMGNPYVDMVHGLSVGHLYYFLVEVTPRVLGKDILVTPRFLIDQFGVGEYRPAAPARNPADQPRAGFGAQDQPAARPQGHNWGGGGRALGRG